MTEMGAGGRARRRDSRPDGMERQVRRRESRAMGEETGEDGLRGNSRCSLHLVAADPSPCGGVAPRCPGHATLDTVCREPPVPLVECGNGGGSEGRGSGKRSPKELVGHGGIGAMGLARGEPTPGNGEMVTSLQHLSLWLLSLLILAAALASHLNLAATCRGDRQS
uniref:Uncharacterized protein n=1 Tax=Oryza sativa subsp. japonica TaxID=39947 RepID=Q75LG3_ORYSJ|nr:hypothetical protein [Oryza sativa Japonica Group]